MKARLTEVMESIQGEGLLAGCRQVFVRFSGCNLHCRYCDTPFSTRPAAYCHISPHPGRRKDVITVANPVSVAQLIEFIAPYSSRWVSLTGGEPLLWADFIEQLCEQLKKRDYKILLETNGTLYEQLQACMSGIDLVSMDYKLPSAAGQDYASYHQEFLHRLDSKPSYVKIVVEANSTRQEILTAARVISEINRNIPVILQPVSPVGESAPPDIYNLLTIQAQCQQYLQEVRILPQLHNYLGLI